MAAATISQTEAQALEALRSFIVGILPSTIPVVQGQTNRVASPQAADYVVFWPFMQSRLSTNISTYNDNIIVASIVGSVMTVTGLVRSQSPLGVGVTLTDGTLGLIAVNSSILTQLSGSVGGTGTYSVAPSQNLSSEQIYAGVRNDFEPTQMSVQIDVHGPNSGNNVKVIEALFRSEYGTIQFDGSPIEIAPLYCSDPRQLPFLNDQRQYENRWTIDAEMQINPTIGTQQQFADEVVVTTIEVETTYP